MLESIIEPAVDLYVRHLGSLLQLLSLLLRQNLGHIPCAKLANIVIEDGLLLNLYFLGPVRIWLHLDQIFQL